MVHTDQGRNFEALLCKEVCRVLGIQKTRTCPFHPQSDGLVERLNRTILAALRANMENNQDEWDGFLPFVMSAYRSSAQASAGVTPNALMLGREANTPLDLLTGGIEYSEVEQVARVQQNIRAATAHMTEVARCSLARQQRNYDAHALGKPLKVGDQVYFFNPARTVGVCPKLQSR